MNGGQFIGPYQVLRTLGRGGMAEVLAVRAMEGPLRGQTLALKRLLPRLEEDGDAVRLFRAEAGLSSHLHHPNIVTVVDVGEDGPGIYMVMELIDGRDVGQILRRCREREVFWPVDFAVYLTRVLLDAVGYAHAVRGADGHPLGIIHCDVSPSNFFVSRTGDLKLGDFGVARSVLESGAVEVMGKPFYLSPEALEGHLDQTVDLWAVAVTLYELLTLRRPFPGKTREQVFESIRRMQYTPVREIRPEAPAVLEGLLARAFDVDPALRFTTAGEFAASLMPLFDERVGTPLAISAVVRGLFGSQEL